MRWVLAQGKKEASRTADSICIVDYIANCKKNENTCRSSGPHRAPNLESKVGNTSSDVLFL